MMRLRKLWCSLFGCRAIVVCEGKNESIVTYCFRCETFGQLDL